MTVGPGDGFAYDPADLRSAVDVTLLDNAVVKAATPLETVPAIDDLLGDWYFGLDDINDRYGAMRAQCQVFSQDRIRRQVDAMTARVPDDRAVACLKPLLAFGDSNDVVARALTMPMAARPAELVQDLVKQPRRNRSDDVAADKAYATNPCVDRPCRDPWSRCRDPARLRTGGHHPYAGQYRRGRGLAALQRGGVDQFGDRRSRSMLSSDAYGLGGRHR